MANIRKIICGTDPLNKGMAFVVGQKAYNGWTVHSIIKDIDYLKEFGIAKYDVYIEKDNNIELWTEIENQSVIVQNKAVTDEEYWKESITKG